MEETTCNASEAANPPEADSQTVEGGSEAKTESNQVAREKLESIDISKDESGIGLENLEDVKVNGDTKEEGEGCEANEDARSLGDLDSLPAADELALGAAGSDSGVEGCGRALSSGGGSRSCASSVVSCGSGCGSESSSVAGAPRPRRRVNVAAPEPRRGPLGASTPRPATAPRGPNLATRERARSREKPTPPEKPRPLTPKPRVRPAGELPSLVRESPALRAKPTKTSAVRCRTPNSPSDEKKWPPVGARLAAATAAAAAADASATRVAADKYGTLPRRRAGRDGEAQADGSPKHELTPPTSRRPTITRSVSSRSTVKMRVKIYAEKVSQTVLVGTDIESALQGIMPNIESRVEVSRCHRGVQASARDVELSKLAGAAASARAAADHERALRLHAEAQLAAERAARTAALAELDANSQRLIDLAGAGAVGGADGCLAALEQQLRAASELAAEQRREIDALRTTCDALHAEASRSRSSLRATEARLAHAERDAAEMQDFLAAETGALTDSLREADAELLRVNGELERSRAECRQLVRMCEQRRQEALSAAATARRAQAAPAAAPALDRLAKRLQKLSKAVLKAYNLPPDVLHPTVYYNDAYSRSDSGEALSPEEERPPPPTGAGGGPGGGGLAGAVARALRADDERSRASEDNDNSADLLDSETEPCLVTDPDCLEEWWSGASGAGGWSGEDLSPERESCGDDKEAESASERESLRNLSAAIAARQRSEAEERAPLVDRVLAIDNRLADLLRVLRAAAAHGGDDTSARLALALKEKIDITEKNVADVVVKKLAELDASKNMMDQYRHSVETLKRQITQSGEDDDLEFIEEELSLCVEGDRRALYEALDGAAAALAGSPAVAGWPRLAGLHQRLERLAFAAACPPPPIPPRVDPTPLHTTA